jgi:hypothetical protein
MEGNFFDRVLKICQNKLIMIKWHTQFDAAVNEKKKRRGTSDFRVFLNMATQPDGAPQEGVSWPGEFSSVWDSNFKPNNLYQKYNRNFRSM